MANIFVSAHGGRWSNQSEDLTVPDKSKIVYYVKDGGILSNEEGYKIFNNLQNGQEPGGNVVQEIFSGKKTYDYSCWYAKEFPKHCGIFEAGTGKLLMDLKKYTESNPLLLSDIFDKFNDKVVYWVCCREITMAGANTLHKTVDAWPLRLG